MSPILRSRPSRRRRLLGRDLGDRLGARPPSYDHVDAVRIANSAQSHDLIAGHAGTDTWVFGPDGDELYDPGGLRRSARARGGRYDEHFRLIPAMLHAVRVDESATTGAGYLSPPSRCGGKLFNFVAIDSWTNVHRQCLHDGDVVYGWAGSGAGAPLRPGPRLRR